MAPDGGPSDRGVPGEWWWRTAAGWATRPGRRLLRWLSEELLAAALVAACAAVYLLWHTVELWRAMRAAVRR